MLDSSKTKSAIIGGFLYNPIFALGLGLAPAIMIATTVKRSLFFSACFMVVFLFSTLIVSLIRKIIKDDIKVPVIMIIISVVCVAVDLLVKEVLPELHSNIDVYLHFVVGSTIIFARLSAYSRKNTLKLAMIDFLSMGGSYVLSLVIIGMFREVLAKGSILGVGIIKPVSSFFGGIAGGFIILVFMVVFYNIIFLKRVKEQEVFLSLVERYKDDILAKAKAEQEMRDAEEMAKKVTEQMETEHNQGLLDPEVITGGGEVIPDSAGTAGGIMNPVGPMGTTNPPASGSPYGGGGL